MENNLLLSLREKYFFSDFSNCVIGGGWVYKLPVVTGVKSAVVEQSSTSRSYSRWSKVVQVGATKGSQSTTVIIVYCKKLMGKVV